MWSGKETRQYCLIDVKSPCFGVNSEFLLFLSCVLVAQLCPTLCDPIDCSLPDSSVHETLQARILEWVVISFSRDLSNPGIKPRSPTLQADSLPSEPQASLLFLLVVCLFVRRTCSG